MALTSSAKDETTRWLRGSRRCQDPLVGYAFKIQALWGLHVFSLACFSCRNRSRRVISRLESGPGSSSSRAGDLHEGLPGQGGQGRLHRASNAPYVSLGAFTQLISREGIGCRPLKRVDFMHGRPDFLTRHRCRVVFLGQHDERQEDLGEAIGAHALQRDQGRK